MDVQRADAAGEAGPDGEGQHAVPERIDAGRAGQRLVVAHGVKGAPEPKGRQASIEQRDRDQRGEGEPVVTGQRGDGDHRSAGQAEDGLPASVQLAAPAGEDALVLAAGRLLESLLGGRS